MKVHTFVTGAFAENAYLVSDPASGAAAMIDPGAEGEQLVEQIRTLGVDLRAIWLTHAHVDHIGGIAPLVRAFGAPVSLHPDDLPLYERGEQVARMYGIDFDPPPAPDAWFSDGDSLSLGTLRFTVMHAPGHAPGHVVLHGEGSAFVGDCLFAGSIGRTDLPLSDGATLERSLARIVTLPGETVVYPGHGDATTIAEELRTNPFLTGVARPLRR